MILFPRVDLRARASLLSDELVALAASLETDLRPLIEAPEIWVPAEKAKLTRRGGRCRADGTLLSFEPTSPRRHTCPACGTTYEDEEDYLWWVMGYQLWLAERAVQASTLYALRGDQRAGEIAGRVLHAYTVAYPCYPNQDNVLGPSRPFFSTYLESLWLLHLLVATDLYESGGGDSELGQRVRQAIVEPSARLIASYDEGDSNRQVWNNAALLAAGRLLDDASLVEQSVYARSGLLRHLSHGLLSDGSWYEGENYHLFAHRGLWYAVTIAEQMQAEIPPSLLARFQTGFAIPFVTALPNLSFPARRDSQYGASLRQWRTAESCELGVARNPDDAFLRAALTELYRDDVPVNPLAQGARRRSTGEAERNAPPTRLDRADLNWKSLLFALPDLPTLSRPEALGDRTALLEGQGYAVFRRASEAYVALDYGHSGAGHGHPDRLNLWLVVGPDAVLEDVGTGSYVDPTLHWYRSTLAHNAPLADGVSQPRQHGRLLAWDAPDGIGWVEAEASLAADVQARRTVVVAEDYAIDEVTWSAPRDVMVDLPVHVVGNISGVTTLQAGTLTGGVGMEDGFRFVRDAQVGAVTGLVTLDAGASRAAFDVPAGSEWWRAVAPGPPGEPPRPFHLVRVKGPQGRIRSVWTWVPSAVVDVGFTESEIEVRRDMARVDRHHRAEKTWVVRREGKTSQEVRLGGSRVVHEHKEIEAATPPLAVRDSSKQREVHQIPVLPTLPRAVGELTRRAAAESAASVLRFRLGRAHYRRSEVTWEGAGRPEALICLAADEAAVAVEVSVRKLPTVFAAPRHENPLDNEPSDINSDGVQLHLRSGGATSALSWLVVPDGEGLRQTARGGEAGAPRLDGQWRSTAAGYQLLLFVPRTLVGTEFGADVIVNEISPERERRRGQLVLSGADGEWVYLRGDRQDTTKFLSFTLANG